MYLLCFAAVIWGLNFKAKKWSKITVLLTKELEPAAALNCKTFWRSPLSLLSLATGQQVVEISSFKNQQFYCCRAGILYSMAL